MRISAVAGFYSLVGREYDRHRVPPSHGKPYWRDSRCSHGEVHAKGE